MNVEVSQIDVALTADGTAQGFVTVASTSGFLPGAVCQLYDNAGRSLTVRITDIPSSTSMGVRICAQPQGGPIGSGPVAAGGSPGFASTLTENVKPNYGRSNVSAFLAANSAHICQNAQIVRVEPTAMAAPLL